MGGPGSGRRGSQRLRVGDRVHFIGHGPSGIQKKRGVLKRLNSGRVFGTKEAAHLIHVKGSDTGSSYKYEIGKSSIKKGW